jgi:hypothetical protein
VLEVVQKSSKRAPSQRKFYLVAQKELNFRQKAQKELKKVNFPFQKNEKP